MVAPYFRILLTAGLLLAVLAVPAPARDCRVSLLPNGDVYDCLTCHRSFGGDVRNAFGLEVEAVVIPGGCDPFWDSILARMDADGDGYTNGQELLDPRGVWYFPLPNPGPYQLAAHPAYATSTPPWGPVVLNEVLSASDSQAIELKNSTLLSSDLSGWWITYNPGPANFPLPASLTLPASGFVVVHWNADGVDDASGGLVQHLYTGLSVPPMDATRGSLALYRSGNFTDPGDLAAYVQWGEADLVRSSEAATSSIWPSTGDYVPAPATGASLEYDGEGFAPSAWAEQPDPTLGAENTGVTTDVPRALW